MNPRLFHSRQNGSDDHREFCLCPLFQSATYSNTSLANLPISALLYQHPHLLWPRSSWSPTFSAFLFLSYTLWINSAPPELIPLVFYQQMSPHQSLCLHVFIPLPVSSSTCINSQNRPCLYLCIYTKPWTTRPRSLGVCRHSTDTYIRAFFL